MTRIATAVVAGLLVCLLAASSYAASSPRLVFDNTEALKNDNYNKGFEAMRRADYPTAVRYFERAQVDLPGDQGVRMALLLANDLVRVHRPKPPPPPDVSAPEQKMAPRNLEEVAARLKELYARAQRDHDKAKRLLATANTQINTARAIMNKFERGEVSSEQEQALAKLAPETHAYGQKLKEKAEKALQDAERHLAWSQRALRFVDPNKEHPPTNLFEAGLGFISSGGSACQVRVKGESEPRPPPHDFDRLVPGDAFVTKEQGGVRVFAFNTINTEITMDAQTALRLEQETKDASVWWLEQGRIHVSTNFGVLDASDRAPIIKAAFQTVEADVGSEYDIVVDDRGAVSVKVYRGNVRTRENFADRILMDNLEQFLNQRSNKKSPPQWWEPKGIP